MNIITTSPTPIIESFLANFPKNIIEVAFYFEESKEGHSEEISIDILSEWLCKNHHDLILEFKYYDTEYSANMTNWYDMINNIETFRKDIQKDFLSYYINNF
jgi:hypothetical protein